MIKNRPLRWGCGIFLLLAWLTASAARAAQPETHVAVTVQPNEVGPAIPAGFLGLSYEINLVRTNEYGKYYFNPRDRTLLNVYRTLGIKSLRVGGNTADRMPIGLPSHEDDDSLFAFAQKAGVKVVYNLRLDHGDINDAAAHAKYLMDRHGKLLECLTIGNEPNDYITNYSDYRDEMGKYRAAILAAAPEAKFCGPSTTHAKPDWAADYARDFAHDPHVDFISQHLYVGKNGRNVTNETRAIEARAKLLSPEMVKSYETFYQQFVPTVVSNGLNYRLEEVNSFSRGGAREASDAFVSALWAVDYLHWWASRGGVIGFNFHMGRIYGAFVDATNGYFVRPLGYGIKAFDLGGHGRIVKTSVTGNPDDANLTAYGVSDQDGLCVTLINKEHDAGARSMLVTVDPGRQYRHAEIIFLTAPNNDLTAKSDLTLGGAPIREDGSWRGKWSKLAAATGGPFDLKIPAATAAIVRIH